MSDTPDRADQSETEEYAAKASRAEADIAAGRIVDADKAERILEAYWAEPELLTAYKPAGPRPTE